MAGSSLSYFFFFLREADKHVDRHAVRLISPPTIVLLRSRQYQRMEGGNKSGRAKSKSSLLAPFKGKRTCTIVLGIQDRKQKILYFVGGGPIRKDD